MKDINLYSKKKEKKQLNTNRVTLLISIVIVIAVITVGSFVYLNVLISDCNEKIEVTDEKIESFSKITETKKSINQYNEKIERISKVMESLSNKSLINTSLLQKISKLMPEDMFLLSYSVLKNNELKFIGKSKDKNSIAYFIKKLEELKMFKKIKINTIQNDTENQSEVDVNYKFDIEVITN